MTIPVKVSVIMPVYNGAAFLELSIRSILAQTFSNFELIILDDDSTDGSWGIISRLAGEDHRIQYKKNVTNQGLVNTLNSLLKASSGEFIARQDHDDISLPSRLEQQVAFMDDHPEVGLLGTAFNQIDMAGNILGTIYQPATDTQIRWKILFANPFAHTSVMLRRSLLTDKGLCYSNMFINSEDYELWIQILQETKAANLSDPLVSWRRNEKGISQTHIEEQSQNRIAISTMQLNNLLAHPIQEEEIESFFCLYTHRPPRKEELSRLLKIPQILRTFSRQQNVVFDAAGLRNNRREIVRGLLESLFNGLTRYGYYWHPGVYRLLIRLLWLDPLRVIIFVFRKGFNFLKKSF